MLPPRILAKLPEGARVVEVGLGGRWTTMEALAEARPDLELVATDVHEERLAEPPHGVETVLDDAFEPDVELYEGARLIYAVRVPAELQPPLARLAKQVGANLALLALKDEWADLQGTLGRPTLYASPDGRTWRVWWAG